MIVLDIVEREGFGANQLLSQLLGALLESVNVRVLDTARPQFRNQ
jgi:hypothetical protein